MSSRQPLMPHNPENNISSGLRPRTRAVTSRLPKPKSHWQRSDRWSRQTVVTLTSRPDLLLSRGTKWNLFKSYLWHNIFMGKIVTQNETWFNFVVFIHQKHSHRQPLRLHFYSISNTIVNLTRCSWTAVIFDIRNTKLLVRFSAGIVDNNKKKPCLS